MKFIKKKRTLSELSPGTPAPVLNDIQLGKKPKITIIHYTPDNLEEKIVYDIKKCNVDLKKPAITWINIDGLYQVDFIDKIGQLFNIHPLTLESIFNTSQRPKIEYFPNYIYIALKMISWNESEQESEIEHISLILMKNMVLSFQEKEGDVFNFVRQRIRNPGGKVRQNGSDYLIYALIDAIVDQYFLILEKLSNQTESLEDILIHQPSSQNLKIIHHSKRNLIFLRNAVWPLREVINKLEKEETDLIQESTRPFLRDIYEHTIQVIETLEALRDMVSSLLDIYLSSISNKMNEVMKVLTIIATIFIPLTFIAGIYGMNFQYMPELSWRFAYPAVLSIMFIVGLGMFFFFKKKKWL